MAGYFNLLRLKKILFKPSKREETRILLAVLITGGFLISFTATSLLYAKTTRELRRLDGERVKLTADLSATKEIVQALTHGNAELAQNLEAERERSEEAEAAALASQETLVALRADVTSQQKTLAASDLTPLINKWSARVMRVECEARISGDDRSSKASAVATVENGLTRFFTNKHVVEFEGAEADVCHLTNVDGSFTIDSSRITSDEKSDLAYLMVDRLVALPNAAGQASICAAKPTIGDRVVILGYPTVGSKQGITATEGIISGFDEDYYITSAKIEKGNSGGAAILVKNDCLLGLPTLVVKGQLEALARILAL